MLSLGAPAFVGGASLDAAQTPHAVSPSAIAAAETLAGLEFTEAERQQMVDGVAENLERYLAIRRLDIGPDYSPHSA